MLPTLPQPHISFLPRSWPPHAPKRWIQRRPAGSQAFTKKPVVYRSKGFFNSSEKRWDQPPCGCPKLHPDLSAHLSLRRVSFIPRKDRKDMVFFCLVQPCVRCVPGLFLLTSLDRGEIGGIGLPGSLGKVRPREAGEASEGGPRCLDLGWKK